jgi:hypothetical protein
VVINCRICGKGGGHTFFQLLDWKGVTKLQYLLMWMGQFDGIRI